MFNLGIVLFKTVDIHDLPSLNCATKRAQKLLNKIMGMIIIHHLAETRHLNINVHPSGAEGCAQCLPDPIF